jgi:tetratricopeptide (TPR) repeat protein
LPWLTLVRFGRWDEVLAVAQPPNTNDFLVDRAMWHFSRGLVFVAKKDLTAAEHEQAAFEEIATSETVKKLSSPAFPVADMLGIAKPWLAGKVLGLKGDIRGMIEQLEKAVAAEEALPYMEPAYWTIPTRPALGAALLQAGDATRAEQIFREDLKRWPRNGWSLFGLEQALRSQGKQEGADIVRRQLDSAWKHADTKLDLAWF